MVETKRHPRCLTCQISAGEGEIQPIGGIIWKSDRWQLEHTISPMGKWGVGTLVLKTGRHVESFAELDQPEVEEFSQILHRTSQVMKEVLNPKQIFICSWGVANRHLHFVLQPLYPGQFEAFPGRVGENLSGPSLQVKMASRGEPLPEVEVLEVVEKIRQRLNGV
jgi:diadenosine tetraphosphate (Ap4A) HIT family hydrolase